MRKHLTILLLLVSQSVFAEWQPDATDKTQLQAAETIKAFWAVDAVAADRYFNEAYGYAVFPKLKRGALVFGWASGPGVVIEQGEAVGRVRQRRFSLGAQVGYQSQSQIIFFKTERALAAFKEGNIEFSPQASATVARAGGASDGGFNPEVAVFSLTPKGLMAEASAGATRYSYKPYRPVGN